MGEPMEEAFTGVEESYIRLMKELPDAIIEENTEQILERIQDMEERTRELIVCLDKEIVMEAGLVPPRSK